MSVDLIWVRCSPVAMIGGRVPNPGLGVAGAAIAEAAIAEAAIAEESAPKANVDPITGCSARGILSYLLSVFSRRRRGGLSIRLPLL